MQVVERCKLEAPLAESYTNKTRKAIVKVGRLFEFRSKGGSFEGPIFKALFDG